MTQYLYRVYYNLHGLRIEVGEYDPERFDGEGGMRFGFTADVHTYELELGKWTVSVNMSSMAVGPEEAEQRSRIYLNAAHAGRHIKWRLERGDAITEIGRELAHEIGAEPRGYFFFAPKPGRAPSPA